MCVFGGGDLPTDTGRRPTNRARLPGVNFIRESFACGHEAEHILELSASGERKVWCQTWGTFFDALSTLACGHGL